MLPPQLSVTLDADLAPADPCASARGELAALGLCLPMPDLERDFEHAPEHDPERNDACAGLWHTVVARALDVARREPLLAPRLQALLLLRDSPVRMLAHVLAQRLAGADWPAGTLYQLLNQTLQDDPGLLSQASSDLLAVMARDPSCPHALHVLLNLKGFHALQCHRVAHRLWLQGRGELAYALSNLVARMLGIDIHPAARIGAGVMLDHGDGIVIGETTVIEEQVSIFQHVTLGGTGKERGDRHPKIRRGVLIGAGATVLGNIEVGAMSRIAAGSVVLDPVPSHTTVAGTPASVVRRHHPRAAPALEMDQII